MTEYTQAFPTAIPDNAFFQEGMTLRDYFAAKAMAGLLSNPHCINNPEHVARMSYMHADEILEARSK